jgi:hypothetical protein
MPWQWRTSDDLSGIILAVLLIVVLLHLPNV